MEGQNSLLARKRRRTDSLSIKQPVTNGNEFRKAVSIFKDAQFVGIHKNTSGLKENNFLSFT